jgi:2,3-bisphosphoglycerate-dependent phosphoglycerate mutase
MAFLTLSRHGQSYTNAKLIKSVSNYANLLTPKGITDSINAGIDFRKNEIDFDHAFCSTYPRTFITLSSMLSGMGNKPVEIQEIEALIERHYGFTEYMPSDTLNAMYGGGVVAGWDDYLDTIPGDPTLGESQRQVYDRVIPFVEDTILPLLEEGQNVICVNHFYVMRALLSWIDTKSPELMPQIPVSNSQLYTFHYSDRKFTEV